MTDAQEPRPPESAADKMPAEAPMPEGAPTLPDAGIRPNDQGSTGDVAGVPHGTAPSSASPIAAPRKKRRRWGCFVAGGVLLLLLLALGGGGAIVGVREYNALNSTVNSLCTDLESHNYQAAYRHFSAGLRRRYSLAQFTEVDKTLDQVEGSITQCGQAQSGAFSVDLGSHTLTAAAVFTRTFLNIYTGTPQTSTSTATYNGMVTFAFDNGTWLVDRLSTSLLGINPDALLAVHAYCSAFLARNYAAVYAMFGQPLRTTPQSDFVALAQLHDQADSSLADCMVAGIDQGNTDQHTGVLLSMTRNNLPEARGPVTLALEGGSWKITEQVALLGGRDLTSIFIMRQWCGDIASGNYAGAYALSSVGLRARLSESDWAAVYSGANGGVKWTGCTIDPTTFELSTPTNSASAQVAGMGGTVTQTVLATGQQMTTKAGFALSQVPGAWIVELVLIIR